MFSRPSRPSSGRRRPAAASMASWRTVHPRRPTTAGTSASRSASSSASPPTARAVAGGGRPVPAGRGRACPWANRAVIVRRLLGLEDAISMGIAGPLHDERSWRFHLDPDGRDPVLGIEYLGEAYRKADPDFDDGITVPAMVDLETGAVVTNDFQQLTLDFSTQWTRVPPRRARPTSTRSRCAPRSTRSTPTCTPTSTTASTSAGSPRPGRLREGVPPACSTALDWLEERLADQRYLVGRHDHRGRRPAVHDAGPLRRRLPRPLQVQPPQAHRDAGAVGLRARPVPDARASATRSTSTRSSSTTTACTRRSTRPGSCPRARTSSAG